jgi:plastocyanin
LPRGTIAAALALTVQTALASDLTIDVRDASGQPLADAIVYAEPSSGNAPAARPGQQKLIDQVNKEFVPRVSVVQAGTSVFFPNSDNIRHSIYSFSPAKTFTTKLYSGREAAPVLFDKTGLVVLGCNIHDKMVAWVFIVDTPWYDKSGADGVGRLEDLPRGRYRITAAAPSLNLEPRTVDVNIEVDGPVHRTLSLGASP